MSNPVYTYRFQVRVECFLYSIQNCRLVAPFDNVHCSYLVIFRAFNEMIKLESEVYQFGSINDQYSQLLLFTRFTQFRTTIEWIQISTHFSMETSTRTERSRLIGNAFNKFLKDALIFCPLFALECNSNEEVLLSMKIR